MSVLAAAIPSLGSAYWMWRQARVKEDESLQDRVDRRSALLDNMQTSLSSEQAKWVTELRTENKDLRTELTEARRDRDRGWDLARYWHGTAHEVLREFRNLRHDAINMMQWIKDASRRSGLEMPATLAPIPDRPDIPMGLEDPK